ncbi:hypothetical protein HZC53_05240 [Candidatus Uhrbacteria bacterium]|nr:hypothetical protein [Candidatus Uhrbacteria bacterium]
MERLSVLRHDSFPASPTLTLYFSEPAGDSTLFSILLEKSDAEALASKGIPGCHRPDARRHTIVSAYSYAELGDDLVPEQVCEKFGDKDDLLIHPQNCRVHEEKYRDIAKALLERLDVSFALARRDKRNVDLYFPLQADERLAVAIFDLSLLDDLIVA